MDINTKKFISKYGIKFAGLYILAFVLLVTFFSRLHFRTFPGDLLVEEGSFTLYLPFTSSLAFAVFFLVIFDIYKNIR
jgi:hypothetical protein